MRDADGTGRWQPEFCYICKALILGMHDRIIATHTVPRVVHRSCNDEPLALWIAESFSELPQEQLDASIRTLRGDDDDGSDSSRVVEGD